MTKFTRGTRPKTADEIIDEITKLIPKTEVLAEIVEGFIEIEIKDFANLDIQKQTEIRDKLITLEKFGESN